MANEPRVPDEDDTLGFMDQHSVSRRDLWKALSLGGLAALASGGGTGQVSGQALGDEPVIKIGDNWRIDTDGGTLRLINDVSGEEFILRDDWIESQYSLVWDALNAPSDTEIPPDGMTISLDTSTPEFRLAGKNSDDSSKFVGTVAATETVTQTTKLIFETAADHDAAIAEQGVHHEQPTGTDWAPADVVEKGYPTDWSTWTISTPAHYWPHDNNTGTTVTDVIGNDNGSISGSSWNDTGVLDTPYLDHDGTDDEVDFGFSTQTLPFTVAVWINPDDNSTFQSIYGNYNGTNDDLYIGISSDGAFLYNHDQGPGGNTGGTVPTDTWLLLAMAIDGSTLRGYENTTEHVNVADNTTTDVDTARNFHISRDPLSGDYNGSTDELLVWNSGLSASELAEVYNAVVGTSEIWYSQVEVGITSQIELITDTTIPTGTSITITIYEDVNNDGSGVNSVTDPSGTTHNYDNSASQNLNGGTDESHTKSGFDGNQNTNKYIIQVELDGDGADPTTASPTMSKVEIDV